MKLHHRHLICGLFLSTLFILFTSCMSDHTPIPIIVTEMADVHTDAEGKTAIIELDTGQKFDIINPSTGLQKDHIYRVLVSFIPYDNEAKLQSSQPAHLLCDSTATPKTDETKVLSVWRTPRYINLHLAPLTQGGTQHWGIITDSIVNGHRYIHLHHNQNGDPTSYTADVYASIPINGNEQITLRINTFDGEKTYEL